MQAAARSNPGLTENVRFWPEADIGLSQSVRSTAACARPQMLEVLAERQGSPTSCYAIPLRSRSIAFRMNEAHRFPSPSHSRASAKWCAWSKSIGQVHLSKTDPLSAP